MKTARLATDVISSAEHWTETLQAPPSLPARRRQTNPTQSMAGPGLTMSIYDTKVILSCDNTPSAMYIVRALLYS